MNDVKDTSPQSGGIVLYTREADGSRERAEADLKRDDPDGREALAVLRGEKSKDESGDCKSVCNEQRVDGKAS